MERNVEKSLLEVRSEGGGDPFVHEGQIIYCEEHSFVIRIQ